MRNLNVPLFSQKDPRWAEDNMGQTFVKIKNEGCLLCCSASGFSYLGYPVDPGELNRRYHVGGYLQDPITHQPTNQMLWLAIEQLTGKAIMRAEYQGSPSEAQWRNMADWILNDRRPVWVEVKLNDRQHWVLLVGKTAGNDYQMMDPWYGDIRRFNYPRVFRLVSYKKNNK